MIDDQPRDRPEDQAGVPQIEVTPSMIRSASNEIMDSFADYLPVNWPLAEIVAERVLRRALASHSLVEAQVVELPTPECRYSLLRSVEPQARK